MRSKGGWINSYQLDETFFGGWVGGCFVMLCLQIGLWLGGFSGLFSLTYSLYWVARIRDFPRTSLLFISCYFILSFHVSPTHFISLIISCFVFVCLEGWRPLSCLVALGRMTQLVSKLSTKVK